MGPRPANIWPLQATSGGQWQGLVPWSGRHRATLLDEEGVTGFANAGKAGTSRSSTPNTATLESEVQRSWWMTCSRANPDISYIVGTTPTAAAAAWIKEGPAPTFDKIKVLAYYFTPPLVYQGIKEGSHAAANGLGGDPGRPGRSTSAIRILEGKDFVKHVVGPALYVIGGYSKKTSTTPTRGTPRWHPTTSSRPSAWK